MVKKKEIPEPKNGRPLLLGEGSRQLFHFQTPKSWLQINQRRPGRWIPFPHQWNLFEKQTTPLLSFHQIILKGWFNCKCWSHGLGTHFSIKYFLLQKKALGNFAPKRLEFRGDTWTFLKCERNASKMPGTWDSIENALMKPVDRTVQHCNKKPWRLTKDGFNVCFFWFQMN